MNRRRPSIVALVTALILGVGAIVLQRWVAQTFQVAVGLLLAWFAIVTAVAFAYQRKRPGLRLATLGVIGVIGVASAGIGYWTAFHKTEVDEQVVAAAARASGEARTASLTEMVSSPASGGTRGGKSSRPLELASGAIAGADGHDGEGTATVVESAGGERVLTLTGFDVDAGPDVNVYLNETTGGIDGAIDLGDLRGERGDQEYEIPADADLTRFDDVVLYCIPFTTRIAIAELR